jgi:hypothetical protein
MLVGMTVQVADTSVHALDFRDWFAEASMAWSTSLKGRRRDGPNLQSVVVSLD